MDARYSCMVLLLLSVSCATTSKHTLPKTGNKIVLLDPSSNLGETWEHRALRKGETTYRRVDTSL
jgi:hypothetical protein